MAELVSQDCLHLSFVHAKKKRKAYSEVLATGFDIPKKARMKNICIALIRHSDVFRLKTVHFFHDLVNETEEFGIILPFDFCSLSFGFFEYLEYRFKDDDQTVSGSEYDHNAKDNSPAVYGSSAKHRPFQKNNNACDN